MPPLIGKHFFAWLLLFCSAVAMAQPAGQVEFARGVGFAQSPGQTPRTLGKGLPLKEGDKLTTSEGAYAIVKLEDGTQMTIRPNSEMLIQQYQFKDAATDNNMVLQLLKGGFRAITGLINKNSPTAAKVVTPTSTIGIRGTDFDARLCRTDCQNESSKVSEAPRANAVLASAKLVTLEGAARVVDGTGNRRIVVEGGSVYPGDVVETGDATKAVFAFRDESRVTVGSATHFKVDSFVFDQASPNDGRFLVSLLRGSMRALTGLIGKANVRNVSFVTPTSTIGIRGTGLDMDCSAEGSCNLFTWLGTIEVAPSGPNGPGPVQVLGAGQGLFVGQNEIRPLTAPTLGTLPRPDGVKVDVKQLFLSGKVDDGEEGLYVFVRDGHIELTTGKETLHLGRGETGFANANGLVVRPLATPLFLDFDLVPRPNTRNFLLRSVLNEVGVRTVTQCK